MRLLLVVTALLAPAASAQAAAPKLFAFYSSVPGARERLAQVGSRVTVLAPNWFALDTGAAAVTGGPPDERVMALSRAQGFAVWPVVNAQIGTSPVLDTPAGRVRVAGAIVALAARYGLAGVTLDFEEMQPGDRRGYTALVRRVARALHRDGRRLAVYALRRTRTEVRISALAYDWRRLAGAADLLLASGYNEHGVSTPPGPVTTRHGFRALSDYAARVSRRKVVPTMGAFGYRWPARGRAQLVASGEAERLWPSAPRIGSADGRHLASGGEQIYYESAEDLWARERTVRDVGARWIGLFSLGREPARFWDGSGLGRAPL